MSLKSSLKIPKFDRLDNVGFAEYTAKPLAVGTMHGGFSKALKVDLPVSVADNVKKRTIVWGYLVLMLGGAPANELKQVTAKNPYTAWENLKSKMEQQP